MYAKADIGKMAVMAQRFLLSAAARSLSIVQVMSLPDQEIEALFMRLRWPDTKSA